MKHFILTRFCAYWPGHPSYNDKSWLNHRFNLYKKYNVPSLKNQKEKNFEQVIICDSRVTYDMVSFFKSLPYKTKLVIEDKYIFGCDSIDKNKQIHEQLDLRKILSVENDRFILTRYDSDDVLCPNFFKIIQSYSNKIKESDAIIDISNLNRYCIRSKRLYKNRVTNTSPFSSLLCNSGDIKKFLINHGKLINNYNLVIRDPNLMAYLLVHNKNTHTTVRGKLVRQNVNIERYLWKQ